jgi:biopolymer transport protein ExbB/TolQ
MNYMDLIQFIREHFLHALPVILVGLFAAVIALERFWALFFKYQLEGQGKFFERVRELVLADRLQEAVALCDLYPDKPVTRVVREGILRAHQPEESIADGLQLSVSENSEALSKRTGFLSTFANVATLMGLFGTIVGLIQAFNAVGKADPQQKQAILTAGISTAMNATMMGLGIAIPCMLVYAFLVNRANRLSAQLDQSAIKTLDLLRQRTYGIQHDDVKRVA